MSIKKQIISYIKKNRVSTTEVADALGKTGVLPQVFPVNEGGHVVGEINCVFAANESNYEVHEGMRDVGEDTVAMVFVDNCNDRAILGELVAKYALLYQGAKALIVDGLVRDIAAIKRHRFPVWCQGTTPIGCFNDKRDSFPENKRAELITEYQGGIAVCDDGGVIMISNDNINESLLERLQHIEMQEDIWFYCLDTLKWDTHKIVCEKAYFDEKELLSMVHVEQLKAMKSR
ncbi:MAG: demethylmenaquinone methyltransferase [Colwelliaceae bacterium]|nr:demethylmenaquinone methyltransferase [Colwelliaceae bacterium]